MASPLGFRVYLRARWTARRQMKLRRAQVSYARPAVTNDRRRKAVSRRAAEPQPKRAGLRPVDRITSGSQADQPAPQRLSQAAKLLSLCNSFCYTCQIGATVLSN